MFGSLQRIKLEVEVITIKQSKVADTRTCDFTKVTEEMLKSATMSHIEDVRSGLAFLRDLITAAQEKHDRTKLSEFESFYNAFKTGFDDNTWWEMHQREERHHFNNPEYVQDDINLIDVLEQIVDGVMAGLARSGEYRFEPLPDDLLQKAYMNTARLLIDNITIED